MAANEETHSSEDWKREVFSQRSGTIAESVLLTLSNLRRPNVLTSTSNIFVAKLNCDFSLSSSHIHFKAMGATGELAADEVLES